jgi:hypothetical protein
MTSRYMTLNAVVATYGISRSTIYRAAKRGDLEIRKVCGRSLVSTDSVERLIAGAPKLYAFDPLTSTDPE